MKAQSIDADIPARAAEIPDEQALQSFERCYDTYAAMLYRLAAAQLGSQADAEDVVQEAFLRRLQRRNFRDEAHEKRWLIRVTVNLCHNLRAANAVRRAEPLPENAAAPEAEDALALLSQLPEKLRAVFHLYYYEGYRVREISQILHISQSAVKMRLQRGRALLKEQWEESE